MTKPGAAPRSGWWLVLIPVALVVWTTTTASGGAARDRFFAVLRIKRPDNVSVNVPAFSGPTGSRRLQDAIAGMLASNVRVTREARDTIAPDSATAARLAGFAPHLLAARTDAPRFSVETARSISMTVNRAQLQTIMTEAGETGVDIPASVDGGTLLIDTPAAVSASYGHCPEIEGQTLTNQIAQRPPPAAESADCVNLEQRPFVIAKAPPALDMQRLTGIALEVAGMSPNQQADFLHAFPWPAALTLTMPRVRSYDTTRVNGQPAMLLNTAVRRGPAYTLLWAAGDRVYSLTGYGNSGDAVTLAASVHAPGDGR
jgi:hypothetical protein